MPGYKKGVPFDLPNLPPKIDYQSKLERMEPYPEQKSNIRPYAALIRKLVKYREASVKRKARK